ncbi:MAG: four helix bundle protein [Alphaproteobacteria bacterium]|nr:four helix bundle protein [Alphaproteobacteria bacterium]
MQSVKDLNVYKLSFETILRIYKITETFPKTETFGLSQQMRRAAVSIISNLSEGSARNHTTEYKRFVGISRGSASELLSQIEISNALGFIKDSESKILIDNMNDILRMLSGLLNSLDSKIENNNTNH